MVGPLTDAERYSFDLQGFLVRRGVLAPAELAALHEAIDGLGLAPPGETIPSQRFSDHLREPRHFSTSSIIRRCSTSWSSCAVCTSASTTPTAS